MDWILLSLVSAFSFSAYSIIQKYAFQKGLSSVFAFGFWGGMLHLALAGVILALDPVDIAWTSLPVITVLGAGLLNTGVSLLISRMLQRGEVTRVVPIIDTYPVFVAVMAIIFLGEDVTPLKWMAIFLVICGAVLASGRPTLPGSLASFGGPFFLLLTASFGIATYSILAKYALGHLDFWHVYAISSIGSAPAFAYAVHAFRAWPQVRLAGRSAGGLAVTWSAHGVIGLAFLACLWAFELGPVSLSSAIMAARPVIVLTYATLIGILLPKALTERTAGPALLEKGMAAALVTTGVGAMSLL